MGYLLPLLIVGLALCVSPTVAFGAGNIPSTSVVENINFRHGDIEDTLLQLFLASAAAAGNRRKFTSMDVKRIYFGNWLRDYSQAIDTGALKHVEAPTIRLLLWLLGFLTFGYATAEFEVTEERLGCYRPEEHIDNPKDYNDNQDARELDPRLRGPIDEEIELGIDPETGMKNYIANENIDRLSNGDEMHTSSKLLRDLFRRSIEMGRDYANNGDEATLFEAFRLMGTGLHCLEDFSAHSNYTELALIEMGEEGVFPHVGSNTRVNVDGKDIWPLVTGTFGGVDFLHSVIGEVSDKAMQSEMSRLENQISAAEQAAQNEGSDGILQRITDLIGKIPNLNSGDEMSQAEELKRKSQEQKESGQPWGVGDSADQVINEIMPYLEFHDKLMRKIEATGIGIITEKLAEVTTLFVFSLIAPWLLPILRQVSSELKTGSSEVIASSENAQHVVFNDDDSSNPTHSMLSKDHFSNVLNEPAGKIASAVLKFAVPLLMEAWDDEGVDINNTIDTIINGVFHHPALRDSGRPGQEGRQAMFQVVEEWWNSKSSSEQDTLREQLSREGVQAGKNHVENAMTAQYGHGCGAPMYPTSQPKTKGEAIGQLFGGAVENALTGGGKSEPTGMGGLLGGLLGGVAENMLGENRGGSSERTQYGRVGDTYDSYGGNQRSQDNYGQESSGYGGDNYSRNEQSYGGYGGGEEQTYGGYGRNQEQSYGGYGGNQESSYGRREERYDAPAEDNYETEGYGGESRGYGGGESRSYYGGNNEGQ
ncbi:heterokaryon incompatibility protein Het-C-domain-containing protein [Pyronema omphalodes]|nr:heterokaryon incompatibility protein Het-C-domain-containing protein [Pyronema omphalodes]